MRFLLDTHCWLWLQTESDKFSEEVRTALGDPANEIILSAVSSWEIAIKYARGKLPLPEPPSRYVPSRMATSGTSSMPIHHSHTLRVAELPLHHRDPFDRLLVAQAQIERLTLVSADPQLTQYDIDLRLPR